jgi:hypothetical protein
MDAQAAATASGETINGLGSLFMLDMDTYAHGATLGFAGIDFYLAGRAGVLGEVPAEVVVAALVFFEPATVVEAWERSAPVMARRRAAEEFAAVGHRWAEAKLPDAAVAARIAELTGRMVAAASVSAAPLFAGWRTLDEPSADRPEALALHRVNALRELRGALHGAAVITHGIDPHAAVARRTPYMLDIFGWKEPHPDKSTVREPWDEAQALTDRGMAPAYECLTDAERDELVELLAATQAAVTGG